MSFYTATQSVCTAPHGAVHGAEAAPSGTTSWRHITLCADDDAVMFGLHYSTGPALDLSGTMTGRDEIVAIPYERLDDYEYLSDVFAHEQVIVFRAIAGLLVEMRTILVAQFQRAA